MSSAKNEAASRAITGLRDQLNLKNSEVWELIFAVAPRYVEFTDDRRTKESKEEQRILAEFQKASTEFLTLFTKRGR